MKVVDSSKKLPKDHNVLRACRSRMVMMAITVVVEITKDCMLTIGVFFFIFFDVL